MISPQAYQEFLNECSLEGGIWYLRGGNIDLVRSLLKKEGYETQTISHKILGTGIKFAKLEQGTTE